MNTTVQWKLHKCCKI